MAIEDLIEDFKPSWYRYKLSIQHLVKIYNDEDVRKAMNLREQLQIDSPISGCGSCNGIDKAKSIFEPLRNYIEINTK